MGIQYWVGMKQDEESVDVAVHLLQKIFNTKVVVVSLNKHFQDGMSISQVKEEIKKEFERKLNDGFNIVVAHSTGASLYLSISSEKQAEKVIFLSPAMKPINIMQMWKYKSRGKGENYKKFTFRDIMAVYRYAFSARKSVSNLVGIPTLIIQAAKDEYVQQNGSINLQKKLLKIDKSNSHLHQFHLINGEHDLIHEKVSRDQTLQLIIDFILKLDKNNI